MWKRRNETLELKKRVDNMEKQLAYITEFCQAVKLNEMGIFTMLKQLKNDLSNASAIVDHKNVKVTIPTTYYHDVLKPQEKKEVQK